MIYSRFHEPVRKLRVATIPDVRRLAKRQHDEADVRDIREETLLVAVYKDGTEDLVHIAFLRADGGAEEIARALRSR